MDKASSSVVIWVRVLTSMAVEGLYGQGAALRVPGLGQKEPPDSGYPASFRESCENERFPLGVGPGPGRGEGDSGKDMASAVSPGVSDGTAA